MGGISKNHVKKVQKTTFQALFQCLTSGGGGGPLQKFQKMRFFKNYDTLTLIPLRQKTQLTKVVSFLKGFGDPIQTL